MTAEIASVIALGFVALAWLGVQNTLEGVVGVVVIAMVVALLIAALVY